MTERREPEDDHGYSPDVGRGSEEVRQAGDRAFSPEEAGPPGEGRELSEEELSGVSSAETEPGSPYGVGESTARRGEEIAQEEEEAGRETVGVKGESDRPYGTSTAEDSTGVAPQEPRDEESPTMPSGDQGG
ncbi:hypothetical protein [Thermoactinospora rubra]|uniref:hypothetical protein n=1 Tax=Thermoactinospora rubra TaxID=1088767 RepID=UPI00117EBB82|nr:hypothetical protein [Thermoactinospora rubra]